MLKTKKICLIIAIAFWSNNAVALEKVELQLRWHHQFQFAGYYAALEKGFYRDVGLDVELIEGQPDKKPVTQVLNGQASYGVGNSEVLLKRLQGSPLVALAAIFQHSPSVLITKDSSHISTPHELIGKNVMMMSNQLDADFIAMFHNENINPSQINIMPSSYDINDLANDKIDVFNAYISNETYYLTQHGIKYGIINPKHYGVDFYSDILFTSENELRHHSKRVIAFRQASLKGWEYALDHPKEIIELLLNKYHVDKTEEHLSFEAKSVRDLILPNVVEIGHMNPWRWQHMAKTFVDANMVKNDDLLDGFDYQKILERRQLKWGNVGKYTTLTTILSFITLTILAIAYTKTKHEIRLRKDAEHTLKKLAYTDSLTGLWNRHQFFILAEQSIKNAIRSKSSVALCFIDIDDFKQFNDNYGHHVGDLILQKLANVLKNSTRQSDIIARVGGDEFIIILENITTKSEAEKLLSKIQNQIMQPIDIDSNNLTIKVSIGLSIYPEDATSLEALMKQSDNNMYREKRN